MTGTIQQFKALLYKNVLLKRRKLVSTLLSVLLPALAMLVLVWLHSLNEPEFHPEAHHLDVSCNLELGPSLDEFTKRLEKVDLYLGLVPAAPLEEVKARLTADGVGGSIPESRIIGFESVEEFEKYVSASDYATKTKRGLLAAIVLPTGNFDGPDFQYSLRLNASSNHGNFYGTPDTDRSTEFEDVVPGFNADSFKLYCTHGFAALQTAVDSVILRKTGALPSATIKAGPHLSTVLMPTAAYTEDVFSQLVGSYMGLFFTLLGTLPLSLVVGEIVGEKELRIREGARMMGLKSWVITATWWVTYAVLFAVTSLLMVLVGVSSVYAKSNYFIVVFFFFAYYLALYSLAFFLSTFFSKSQAAATFSSIIFIISLFIGNLASSPTASRGSKLITSLLPSVALSYGSTTIAKLESAHVGVTAATVDRLVENLSVADCISMLLLSAALFFVVALYLQEVLPSEYGTPRKLYFFLLPSFWCGSDACRSSPAGGDSMAIGLLDRAASASTGAGGHDDLGTGLTIYDNERYSKIEAPDAVHTGNELVRLRGLRKVFAAANEAGETTEIAAVKGLSLDMYKGQIFTLLGHNGAGKTTTFNMLTGLYPLSSGKAMVLGRDLATDMDWIRTQMGVCPQHDILYEHLSVREHLELYAAIKGVAGTDIPAAAQRMIDEVGLGADGDNKANAFAGTLSGGQKRKLSVGIALIGDSKIVFLDEPSSGMDVASQRTIWDLLLRSKAGRVIVLTTHSMEEAEIGDRIAIMAGGKLMCNGSSLFLKNQYGAGYTLTVSKAKAAAGTAATPAPGAALNRPPIVVAASPSAAASVLSPSSEADVDSLVDAALATAARTGVSPVSALVTAIVPAAEVLSDAGGEISFRLPFAATAVFPLLFDALEQRKAALGVAAAGMSVTTLTEVFLRVGHGHDGNAADEVEPESGAASPAAPSPIPGPLNSRANSGAALATVTSPAVEESDGAELAAAADEARVSVRTLSSRDIFIRHTRALIVRRFHNAKRDKRMWIWQLLIPMYILLSNILSIKFAFKTAYSAVEPALLSAADAGGPQLVPYVNATVADGTTPDTVLESFAAALEAQAPGVGALPLKTVPLEPADTFAKRYSDLLLRFAKGEEKELQFNPYAEASTPAAAPSLGGRVRSYAAGLARAFSSAVTGAVDATEPKEGRRYVAMAFQSLDNVPVGAADPAGADADYHATFFVNATARDGLPLALNAWTNTLLRSTHPAGSKDPAPTVTVTNQPFDRTSSQMSMISAGIAFAVCMAMAFVPATFASFLVKERTDKGKHLQLISGVSPVAYWASAFVWDTINFVAPFILVMVVLVMFSVDSVLGAATPVTIVTLWLFCVASAPFVYCLSFLFDTHTVAQRVILLLNFMLSVVLLIVSIVMTAIRSTTELNSYLKFLYRLFPPFCLGEVMSNLMVRDSPTAFVTKPSPWDMEVSGYALLFLLIDFVLYTVILFVVEHVHSSGSIKAALASAPWASSSGSRASRGGLLDGDSDGDSLSSPGANADGIVEAEDSDVAAERARIAAGECDDEEAYMIVIKGLRKVYPARLSAKSHVAVRSMAYAVANGECFGFLGANGAGKTTTLKMLTGDEIPSSGTALLGGLDILRSPYQVRQLIGYCPQFDALLPLLTAREHLTLYARIKCVPEDRVHRFVAAMIKKLGLAEIADKPAGTYSGGNKRKLSVGIALVGNPPIVFLDEPSTGMDPQARRSMWKLISSTMANRSVILTTHSMEECEALCDRIGIMTGGRLRCLGTAPHLKQRFGSGYQVVAKAREGSADAVLAWVQRAFPSTQVLEAHGSSFKLRISKQEAGPTSAVFRAFESNKAAIGLDSYSVSDTDLEQIFIQMVRDQDAVDRAAALSADDSLAPPAA